MAVNMNGVSAYSAYQQSYQSNSVKESKDTEKAGRSQDTERTRRSGQKQLSKAAQDLLEKLRKKYSNMDFMVADYENAGEAKEILSRGTKEFSVLFSSDELEKMASSEKYEKEYMKQVEGAVHMAERISQQFGKGSEKGEITKVGIAFNSDGTTSFFAELEKSSEQQRERIEAAREKRAQERKAEEKGEEPAVKRTTVYADSEEELLEKMFGIDWSTIREDQNEAGSKINFAV